MDRAHGLLHRHPRRQESQHRQEGHAGGTLARCPRARGQFGDESVQSSALVSVLALLPVALANRSPFFLRAGVPGAGRPGLTHTTTWDVTSQPGMRCVVCAHLFTKRFRTWPFPSSQAPGEEEQRPCRAAVTHALHLEPTVHPTPPQRRDQSPATHSHQVTSPELPRALSQFTVRSQHIGFQNEKITENEKS